MKIVFFSTLLDKWGGSEELWVRVANLALAEGHIVMISVFDWGALPPKVEQLQRNGALIHKRPIETAIHNRVKRKLSWFQKKFRADYFCSDIYAFKPDAILVSMGGTFDFCSQNEIFVLLKKLLCKKYLISQFNYEHAILQEDEIIKAREIFQSACKVFFVSDRNRLVAQRQIASDITNAAVISNPLNIRYELITYPSTDASFNFANVARFDVALKGQDLLLEVLAGEKWRTRNWKLHLYGTGQDVFLIHELISYYKLNDKVIICGHVNNIADDVWSKNHLLVLSSLGEGTPLALIEAMAAGRAAVVTDVGGNAELVSADTGFLAKAPNVNCLADAMEEAWDNRADWKNRGKNAFVSLKERISLNSDVKILQDIVSG